MKFLIERFLEPSSWAGVGMIVNACETIQATGFTQTSIGLLLTGLVAFFMPEKKLVNKEPDEYTPRYPAQNPRINGKD